MFSFPKISPIFKTSVCCSFLALSLSSCSSLQDTSADTVSTQTLNSNSSKDVIDWERPFGIEVGKSSWLDLKQKLNELGVDTTNFIIDKEDNNKFLYPNSDSFANNYANFYHEGMLFKVPNWRSLFISLKKINITSPSSSNLAQFDSLIVFLDEKHTIQKLLLWSENFDVFTKNFALLKNQYPKEFSVVPYKTSLFQDTNSKDLFLKKDNQVIIEASKHFANVNAKNYISLNYTLEIYLPDMPDMPDNFSYKLSPVGYTSKYSFEEANKLDSSKASWYRKNIGIQIVSPKYEQTFEHLLCQKLQDPNTSTNEKAVLKKSLVGYCKK